MLLRHLQPNRAMRPNFPSHNPSHIPSHAKRVAARLASLLLAASAAFAQAAPSLYINGGNLVYQSNGVAVAALQFSAPATTGIVLNAGVTGKNLTCGTTICIIVGNNSTALVDGPLVNLAALPTAIIGVTPLGSAQVVNSITNPCDINKDGKIDTSDLTAIIQIAVQLSSGTADITGDGKTDIFDVFRVILAIGNNGVCRVGPLP